MVAALLVSSASSSDVKESLSDDDDLLSWLSWSLLLSDSDSPTPAIKGLLSSEWVRNLPRCLMTKDDLSCMLLCLAEVSTCLMAAVDNGTS